MLAILISIAVRRQRALSGADQIGRILRETGIRILVRIMGLLLVALSRRAGKRHLDSTSFSTDFKCFQQLSSSRKTGKIQPVASIIGRLTNYAQKCS